MSVLPFCFVFQNLGGYNSVLRPRVVGEWVGRAEEDADPLAAEMLHPPVPRAKIEVCWSGVGSPARRFAVAGCWLIILDVQLCLRRQMWIVIMIKWGTDLWKVPQANIGGTILRSVRPRSAQLDGFNNPISKARSSTLAMKLLQPNF